MIPNAIPKAVTSSVKEFAAFLTDAEAIQAVTQGALDAGINEPHVVKTDLNATIKRLQKMPTPKLIVVDVSGAADPVNEMIRLAEVCDEGVQVIVIGNVNDISLYRNLIQFGVEDYLVKPFAPEEVAATITRAIRGPATDGQGEQIGRLIAVVGARGGVGASTVAVNTAWMIAEEARKRVALVDLDLFFGTCGLALDLDLGRGFREALENPSRIDGLFIERAMIQDGDNLFVLSAEEALDYQITFDPSAVELLIDHLRRDFSYVVVDLPRFASRTQIAMLTPPSSVVVVSDPSLAGMRDTMRLVQLFKKIAPNSELSVVLNRVGGLKGLDLSRKDFEQGAETRVDFMIPFDAKAFASSAGTGRPLPKVAPDSRSTRLMRDLMQRTSGIRSRAVKAPAWKRLLKAS